MKYGSVCSGIEAASIAWEPLGWQPSFFSEIEPFPKAVLSHHWPDVACHGDFTTIQRDQYAGIDLLVGGTPCQSFSIAGLRGGMDDDRGNLALEFLRLADRLSPQWMVWENVPGVLSSNGGRDFGSFLGALGELGYGFAYRSLDAQYFHVPQRRQRVFVVGYLGDWRPPAAVLFESESLRGDSPPRRETGEGVTETVGGSTAIGIDEECNARIEGFGSLLRGGQGGTRQAVMVMAHGQGGAEIAENLSPTLTLTLNHDGSPIVCGVLGDVSHTLTAEGHDASEDGSGRGTPVIAFSTKDHGADAGEIAPTLRAMGADGSHANAGGQIGVVTTLAIRGRDGESTLETREDGTSNAVLTPSGGRAGIGVGAVHYDSIVRRLTPLECERLQGFPDNYTQIPWKGKPAEDCPLGHRYKALGNSFAVPVVRWIGERIQYVQEVVNGK